MRRPAALPRVGRPGRPLLRAAGYVLLLVVLYFVVQALARQLAGIDWSRLEFSVGPALLAALCIMLTMALQAVASRSLLAGFCEPPSMGAVAACTWVPQLGKYLPGKVAGAAGAVWMLSRFGVPGRAAAGAVVLLSGVWVGMGVLVAAPLTLWEPVARRIPQAWLLCLLLVGAGLIGLHPLVFGAVMNLILRILGRRPLPSLPRLRHYVAPVLLALVNWGLMGGALWFMTGSVAEVPVGRLPLLVSAAALASTAGYIALFAPAGIGVRDGILLLVLTPVVGEGQAAVAVLAMRLMQTLVELVMAGAGAGILSGRAPGPGAGSSPPGDNGPAASRGPGKAPADSVVLRGGPPAPRKRPMRRIPGTLLERFADDLTVDERDEMAIPSYTHRNPVMRWMAWKRLEVMAGRLREACAAAPAGAGRAVLDFGCGSGVLLEEASCCADKVYGVDIVLGPARTLVEEWDLEKVELLGPEQAADEIPEGGLDVIMAAQVLEHIVPLDETLALFRKWLKPDGRLLVSLPTENALYRFGRRLAGFHGEYHHHTAASSHREILAAGFRQERVAKIPAPGPLAIYWVIDYVPA